MRSVAAAKVMANDRTSNDSGQAFPGAADTARHFGDFEGIMRGRKISEAIFWVRAIRGIHRTPSKETAQIRFP